MSEQEFIGTGTEASPARDDLGAPTEEALLERMFEPEEQPNLSRRKLPRRKLRRSTRKKR